MRLLLDTHVFLWLAIEPESLSARARALCQDSEHELLLSFASIWEMQIKQQLGKLTFATPLADLIAVQRVGNRIALLPIALAHILALADLPLLHKDPFDRLLIAQANTEGITILSADSTLPAYQVRLIHA
ncbi:MAG TPA: type II toxin-antitoxin system VapC family toxin [Chloroflexota bacterium]|nr:type II toxin-antitoxin system VapC family toxin [Chloroflexota bacterium]